jgi:peptidoglycan hydrolase-like protein with peptidoglycan-binding domain
MDQYCSVVTTWRPVGSPSRNGGGSSYYIQTPDEAQSEGNSSDTAQEAIIAQLQAQIQSLTDQINALLAQRQSEGSSSLAATLTETLQYGSTGSQVVLLQNILQQQGFFPKEVNCNGRFGPTTLKAVQAFQVQNNIATAGSLGYGRVGPSTRAALNQLTK